MIEFSELHFTFDYMGLFVSDGLWIHPKRVESTYEIICVLSGEVWIAEDNTEYCIKQNQAIVLLPNVIHKGVRCSRDVKFYWVHFQSPAGLPFDERFFDQVENIFLFKELLHYNNLANVPHYLLDSILNHILAGFCYMSENSKNKFNQTAEKICEWMRINADSRLTVELVAKQFGYSKDHITRMCKKYFGVGAHELINRFTLNRAKELLCNTDKYVKEISAELSFPTDKAFIGYFKYNEYCSPNEYRNRFGKTHLNKR